MMFFTLIEVPYLVEKIRLPRHEVADPIMLESATGLLQTGNTGQRSRQAIFGVVFALGTLGLLIPGSGVMALLGRQKIMLLFLAYALLSAGWSPAPGLSLKRWVLFAGMLLVSWSAMWTDGGPDVSVRIMRWLFASALLLSVGLYVWRPDLATAPANSFFVKEGTWQGIFLHKNSLASASLLTAALWLPCLGAQARRLDRWLAPWVLLLVIFLAIMSQGKAALLGIIATTACYLGCKFPMQGQIKLLVAYIGIALVMLWFIHFPQLPFATLLYDKFGVSQNLTGRVPLWVTLLDLFEQHPFLGVGYNAFWTPSNLDQLYLIFADHKWQPMQAHNGYIDILNQLGLIGGFLFLLVLVQSAVWAMRPGFYQCVTSMSLFLLLFAQIYINIGESYFCNSHSAVWVTFLLTYVALAKQSLRVDL